MESNQYLREIVEKINKTNKGLVVLSKKMDQILKQNDRLMKHFSIIEMTEEDAREIHNIMMKNTKVKDAVISKESYGSQEPDTSLYDSILEIETPYDRLVQEDIEEV